MSREYRAADGTTHNITIAGMRFLDRITLGLWGLVGLPETMSEEDSKLVARILRNYVVLQKGTFEYESLAEQYYFWHPLGYAQEYMPEIRYIELTAAFFEESGGIVGSM